MPVKPLVSKIRCPSPGKKTTLKQVIVRNMEFVKYIGTREGVDLTNINEPWQQEYDENSRGNTKEAESNVYAKYIAERPNSHGLFGNIDTADINQVSKYMGRMTEEGKNVYRGIVSLSEEDAINLGYEKKASWDNYMRSVMPDIAKEFNIDISKLQWIAAVHMEKGHPHCHYMFWSTDDNIRSKFIHTSKQTRIREFLSKEMFKAERDMEIAEKSAKRELISQMGKRIVGEELKDFLSDNKGNSATILGKVRKEKLDNFGKQLSEIANVLPEKGRLDYKLLKPEAKEKVDKLVDDILQLPAMKKEYDAYLKAAAHVSKTYSPSEKHLQYQIDKADQDIRKRMANIILKSGKDILKDKEFWREYSEKEVDRKVDKHNEFNSDKEEEAASEHVAKMNHMEFQYKYSKEYKEAMNYIYNSEARDIEKAISILQKEVINKNVLAGLELGKIYERGIKPVKKDLERSRENYKKACEGLKRLINIAPSGNEKEIRLKANYEYKLAKMYENGNGTTRNYQKAMELYEKSAAKGNKYAAFSLGNMYLREKGIQHTEHNRQEMIQKGIYYMKQAADNNFPYAAYAYARTFEKESFLRETISEQEVEKYYAAAMNGFTSLLMKREDDFLLYRMGTMYYEGKGTEPSQEKALKCFQKSAELNNANAQYALGKTYSDKESGYYDLKKAIENFKKAADQNNEFAKYTLAKIFLDQTSPVFDVSKGISYLEQASEQGNVNAKLKLGNIYLYGKYQGISKNEELGMKYLKEAEEKGSEFATESIKNYEDLRKNRINSAAYQCLNSIFQTLSDNRQNRETFSNLRKFKTRSAEQRKIDARKNGKGNDDFLPE